MIASSLIGMYFRAPIIAYVTQYADQHDIAKIGSIVEQPSKQTIPLPIQELQQADRLGHAPAVQPRGNSEGSAANGGMGRCADNRGVASDRDFGKRVTGRNRHRAAIGNRIAKKPLPSCRTLPRCGKS